MLLALLVGTPLRRPTLLIDCVPTYEIMILRFPDLGVYAVLVRRRSLTRLAKELMNEQRANDIWIKHGLGTGA